MARRGCACFPLAPRDKVPLIAKSDDGNGCLDATTDTAQIHAWWSKVDAYVAYVADIETGRTVACFHAKGITEKQFGVAKWR